MNNYLKEFFLRTIVAVPLLIGFIGAFFYAPPMAITLVIVISLVYILFCEWPHLATGNWWLLLLTPLYPIAPFLCLIALNQNPVYRWLLFRMVLIVVTYDTGAYLVGSSIGKIKLAPTLSPQKTWEGCAGGYAAALTLMLFFNHYFALNQPFISVALLCAVLCTLAQVGDLFESLFKRRVHIKHSGTLLGSHGGVFDRFDSLLSTGVFVWLFRAVLLQKM
jgi:phosphatidate cytidylyltransferase